MSKRRSKTSLTPGIFILYIYIYSSTSVVPGAGLLGETLRTYSLPFLRNASRLLRQNPVFLCSLCLFPAFFRITILKILDKPGASAVTFRPFATSSSPLSTEKTATLSRLLFYRAKANGIIEISARTMPFKHFRSFDTPSILPRNIRDNCLRMKLNSLLPMSREKMSVRNRFFFFLTDRRRHS